MEKEATHNDILNAINTFSTHIDAEISGMKSDIGSLKSDVSSLKSDVSSLKSDVSSLKSDVSSLKSDVGWIKSNMVTKDFLDEKLADLRGDLVVLVRKEDTKLLKLIDILKGRQLISAEEATVVLSMEPFAKLSL